MQFNRHSDLEGLHAFLAPSKPAWMGYDDDKFDRVYMNHQADRRGDRLHKLAADCITERINLEKNGQTVNMYVNDSIGFRLQAEKTLFYSEFAFGHADAIGLTGTKLRVSDLKTGVTPTHFEQLLVYLALFCLEYSWDPFKLEMEMRIYQNDAVRLEVADPVNVSLAMERIRYLDKRIRYLREEAAL